MKLISLISITLLFVFVTTSQIISQGLLKGVVTDSLTNNELIGANVFIVGTSLGSATNIDGKYTINTISPGKYIVKISYIGYKAKETEVEIKNYVSTELNIQLVLDVLVGEEVLITGQMMGQVSAINQQRTSNTIINVVSEEKIKELADANATESIGRLPGVSVLRSGGEANKIILRGLADKFTVVTIDGMKVPPTDATGRGIDLSMISQSSLSGIELYKALTSDKDGDALAGSVNLVTRTAPEEREARVDLKGGYNDMMNSFKQYDFSFHYGERFFDNFLGVQINGNVENKIRSNERINVDYGYDANNYYINNFKLEYTNEVRYRHGFSLLLDLKTPDDGAIRINNVYGHTKRDYFWFYREYKSNNVDDPEYDYRDREQEIGTFNSSVKGDNNILGFKLNWALSFAESEAFFPYDYEMIFVEDGGMQASDKIQSNPEQLIKYAFNNYNNANLDWAYFRSQDNYDKERTAFLDISRPFVLTDFFSFELKTGAKYRIKDRSNNRTEDLTPYYLGRWMEFERLPDGTFRRKDFTGSFFEDWWLAGGGAIGLPYFYNDLEIRNVYNSYPVGPLINRDRVRQWRELNQYGVNASGSTQPNAQEVWINPLIGYDNYNITEKVGAFYGMGTFKFGQILTILAGVRMEKEDNDYRANYMTGSAGGFPVDAGVIRDTTSSSQQTIILPNINVAFKPTDFINIRLALYKALARPDFNMRLDRYIAGRPAEVGSRPEVYVGNINLKTAEAWNYEINTSFFSNEIGLISISAYYKEIDNMFHMLNNFNTAAVRDANNVLQDTLIQSFGIKWPSNMGTTAYNLTLPYNSIKPTKVWGLEFEHQINFMFMPGLLKNIVLSYNASIVRSETVVYSSKTISWIDSSGIIPLTKSRNILVQKKEKLEGMPEFFGNISLGYDIEGFSARVSVFHKGSHNVSFSAIGNDIVTQEFTRLDVALKQKITDKFSVSLNINNILNIEEGTEMIRKQYGQTLFDQSEKYGLTLDLGMSMQL